MGTEDRKYRQLVWVMRRGHRIAAIRSYHGVHPQQVSLKKIMTALHDLTGLGLAVGGFATTRRILTGTWSLATSTGLAARAHHAAEAQARQLAMHRHWQP